MTRPDITVVEGSSPHADRSATLHAALESVIAEKGDGMSVAAVLGVLTILQHEILNDWGTD